MPTFTDDNLQIANLADPSKQINFDLSGLTTGTLFQRTITPPDNPGVWVLSTDEGTTGQILTSFGGAGTPHQFQNPDFADNIFRVSDNSDSSKKLAFQVSGVTSTTTRTWTVPDKDLTWDYGTYSPTRSAESNLDSNVTPSSAQYQRVGSVVTVSGRVTGVDPTAAGAASFELTLPIASNIGAVEDCAGVAFSGGIAGQGAAVTGSVANNTAVFTWIAVDTTSQAFSYTYTYEVI